MDVVLQLFALRKREFATENGYRISSQCKQLKHDIRIENPLYQ